MQQMTDRGRMLEHRSLHQGDRRGAGRHVSRVRRRMEPIHAVVLRRVSQDVGAPVLELFNSMADRGRCSVRTAGLDIVVLQGRGSETHCGGDLWIRDQAVLPQLLPQVT